MSNINMVCHTTPYLSLVVFVMASLIGSLLGLRGLFKALDVLHHRRHSYILFVILNHMKRPLYFLIPLLAIGFFTPILDLAGRWVLVSDLIQAFVIIFFTWVLLEVVWSSEAIVKHRCEQGLESAKTRTLKTQVTFVARILVVVILIIMTAVFLMTFDNAKHLGMGLLTSAGVVSVIVGFAAQKTIGSIVAGFQMAFNRMLRMGDGVCIEGQWGQVEEITLTHAVISLLDNRRLIIPITYFMEKPYQNWTLSSSEIIKGVELNVDYSVNLQALRHELDQILANNPLWDKKVKSIQVTAMTDKCMIARVSVSGRNVLEVSDLSCEVREKLITYLYQSQPNALPHIRSETRTKSN